MIRPFVRNVRELVRELQLTPEAGALRRLDHAGLPVGDPGHQAALDAVFSWIGRAQDCSASKDGGVAHHYSLLDGWSASYPETTGYLIPTLLSYARVSPPEIAGECRSRARRMLDWLVSIQFPDGGFQGGVIGSPPTGPVTFNTGQILLGLSAGVREFGDAYREPMHRAADWLADVQDRDGSWRRYPSPLAQAGEKSYETHVAWAMVDAAAVSGRARYLDSAVANARWALERQRPNGWFDSCCLDDHSVPYSHTLGYALRGILAVYDATADSALLRAARLAADGALSALGPHGFLPGRLDEEWRGSVPWACLTGTVQFACCWFILSRITGNEAYRSAAIQANAFVRRTISLTGPDGVRGGVRGSFPVDGDYCQYLFPNWGAKFFLDSHLFELEAVAQQAA